jgi:type IV secretory pathway TraG/TraD family ATPase VirD4
MSLRLMGGNGATLAHLRRVLGYPLIKLAEWCKDASEKYGKEHPAISATLNRFTQLKPEDKEGLSILSTALTETEWLDSSAIMSDLQGGMDVKGNQFDFARLKVEPTTVYLVLPPEYLETHSTWLRVLINAIMLPLLRSTEDAPVPVLFMLDEYAALGRMEIIESNLALMRGYGVKLLPVLQDLSQLKDIHEKRWESFISNAGVRHIFAPQDWTGQKYFSDLAGQRPWTYKTTGQSDSLQTGGPANSRGLSASVSEHVQIVPNYYPQDLGAMQRGQGLLFVAETRAGRANVRQRAIFPDARDTEGAKLLPQVAAMYRNARKVIE